MALMSRLAGNRVCSLSAVLKKVTIEGLMDHEGHEEK